LSISSFAARAPLQLSLLGAQFLALQKGRTQPADDGRHFGLVVDDKHAIRKALTGMGSNGQPHCQLRKLQFTKAPNVLPRLTHLSKNETTIQELTEKAMAPE